MTSAHTLLLLLQLVTVLSAHLYTGSICPRSTALPWLYSSVNLALLPRPSWYGTNALMMLLP